MWGRKKKRPSGTGELDSPSHTSPLAPGGGAVPPLPPLPAAPSSTPPPSGSSSPTVVPPMSPAPLYRAQSPAAPNTSPSPTPLPGPSPLQQQAPSAMLAHRSSVPPEVRGEAGPRSRGFGSAPQGPRRTEEAPPDPSVLRRELPQEICGFKPVELIGTGATGVVYKSVNIQTGEWAAIKLMKRNSKLAASALQSFMKEIDILNKLNHPNIVKVITHSATDDHISLVLEYVDGGSLSSIITKFGRFPESLAAVYMTHVVRGLIYLHENGVIHRDLKGANILVSKEGVAKLVDFGCAAAVCADMTKRVTVVGTPYWMAPEVVEMSGQCPESDIWSVAATIIELITTVPPYWGAPPVSAMFHIVQDTYPPIPAGISPELSDLLVKCFAKEPSKRPTAEAIKDHPWFLKFVSGSEKKSLAPPTVPVSELVDTVRSFNTGGAGDTSSVTSDCSTDDEVAPSPANRRQTIGPDGTDTFSRINELNKTVEHLQAKVQKQKEKQQAFKTAIQQLQQKCTQQQQALASRNTDSKTLQDFFYLLAMAAKLNNEGKGGDINVKSLYERAQKEGIPWNQWPEWIPKVIALIISKT